MFKIVQKRREKNEIYQGKEAKRIKLREVYKEKEMKKVQN